MLVILLYDFHSRFPFDNCAYTSNLQAYHLADLHMDPEIYPNPEQWDPARYLPDAPPVESLAWGAGRHKCVGMRVSLYYRRLPILHSDN